jgi:ATP-dependent DNA ligase
MATRWCHPTTNKNQPSPPRSRDGQWSVLNPIHNAFDLLALGDDDLTGRPFTTRRAALITALADAGRSFHVTPATTDLPTARRWFDEFEGAGLDGLIAKPLTLTYQPDKRVMVKIKHHRTADCVVAGYRLHKSGADAIGSLLLGLYTSGGELASVGVIGALPMARRRALFTELQPLVTSFDNHPWNWAAQVAADPDVARKYGGGSRWNAGKDLSFVPLRPERVVEVRYDHMEGRRFRHTAQFNRWRPDRDPRSCTYAQLEQPLTFSLGDIVPGLGPGTI